MKIEYFGASHSDGVGSVIKGFPAGVRLDREKLEKQMARRSPSRSFESARREHDEVIFESGLCENVTTGEDIIISVPNRAQKSSDYDELKNKPRPSHADYAAHAAYGADYDMRGGGEFSGRMTAPLVAAGVLACEYLSSFGISVTSRVYSVKDVRDVPVDYTDEKALDGVSDKAFPTVSAEAARKMTDVIEKARLDGDSVGGVAECFICGLGAGVGGKHTSGLESVISRFVFGVPSVKGIEFGSGFAGTEKLGSENNDPFEYVGEKVVTTKNDHGGILGGLSSGMPIVFRAALKPVPSISKEQNTVDLIKKENCTIKIKGRHDSCVVPRALPAIESAAALAIIEVLLDNN